MRDDEIDLMMQTGRYDDMVGALAAKAARTMPGTTQPPVDPRLVDNFDIASKKLEELFKLLRGAVYTFGGNVASDEPWNTMLRDLAQARRAVTKARAIVGA